MNNHIQRATKTDLPAILEVQKRAFMEIAKAMGNYQIQPLQQTIQELQNEWEKGIILKYISNQQIVGSIRAYTDGQNVCHIGKLVVLPDCQRQGIGQKLLLEVEDHFPTCSKFTLFTSEDTPFTWHLYQKAGYQTVAKQDMGGVMMLIMEKTTSLLWKNTTFGKIDYADSYTAHTEKQLTVDEAFSIVFRSPRWVSMLMKIRDIAVKPFGLRPSEANQLKPYYEIGGKAAFFTVSDRDNREIAMYENDSHLNSGIFVSVSHKGQGTDVKLTTIVHYNNRLGKIYFLLISPFHRLIVRKSIGQIK